ncbi:MAG: hypothetical protein JWP12_1147 [Bacteroidetes bacterium]|nr:hypothetical protein [Bacteroidota bacterium]
MRRIPIKTYFILVCLLITAGTKTFAFAIDTVPKTAAVKATDTVVKKVPTKAFLDDKVDYIASDSIITDLANKKAYLYNHAVVTYQDMTLKAGYIMIDFKSSTVYAYGIDSAGKQVQRPDFQNKDGKYVAGSIAYNFETKKGKIKDVITQQDEGYIHGRDIKKDTGNVYYVAHGYYTTCDLEHPHYYIRANKIKVIPNDKIVTGPAMLYIADIPTPLAVPFGFFPNKKGRRSGILIPSYGESTNWGFFLKNGGFYFGGNEFVDMALTADVYSNGSFGGAARSSYKERYKFDGSVGVNFSRFINGDRELPGYSRQNDFAVRWTHNQDPKAHPNSRFSANVNVASSTYNKYNGSIAGGTAGGSYLTNQLSSNISYSKTFVGTPFYFSANARHSQSTIARTVDISLPELNLSMNRVYPFKNQSRTTNTWYDKIGVSATLNARNDIHSYDSTLFTNRTLGQMKNGAQLVVPVSTTFNIFKFLTLTPSINGTSDIYFQTIRQRYNAERDTVLTDTVPGASVVSTFSISAALTTRLYGDYYFKTKHLKQIRHVATPTVTMSYRPDFGSPKFGYYKSVQTDSAGHQTQYSIYRDGIYGPPGSGKSGVVAFSLSNSLEAKRKMDSDSGAVYKKVSLIDNLGVAFSYNLAVKSFNWSTINVTGRTKLFKKLDVNANAILNPYQTDSLGTAVDKFEWANGRIGRLVGASLSLGTSLKSKAATTLNPTNPNGPKPLTPAPMPATNNAVQDQLDYINSHPEAYVDFNVPWNLSVYYNIVYSMPGLPSTAKTTQSLTFNGDLSLTKKWKVSLSSGYDFITRQPTLTSINVYRDLHCWEMRFNWVPFGFRQSFSVDISVKASVLKDLKLSRRKDWQDFQ